MPVSRCVGGSLLRTLLLVRPTLLLAVPRVYEKMWESMRKKGSEVSSIARAIASWAKSTSLAHHRAKQQGKSGPWLYGLAKSLVLNKIHAALGLDQCRACFVAAAPSSAALHEYFLSVDLPLYEVYGMSECSGGQTVATVNTHNTQTPAYSDG